MNEPGSGYIWGNLAAHGKTLYHFGEFISTVFCTDKPGSGVTPPQQGPVLPGVGCGTRNEIKPGEQLPEQWGGGVNKFPWAIPLIASNTATKPELVGHFAPEAPDFELLVPDQLREDIFEKHLAGWVADKQAGKDTMPNFIQLRLPNDHTAGTRPGSPTPKASVADNDLAVGRAVEAISHSPFWDDTAFFILEDDAQNGADHVDAHRSIALVVSKYAPKPANGSPYVDSRFYSTVSVLRTMESAARVAADEQQRRPEFADFDPVHWAGRSAGLHGGLLEPREQADLHREQADRAGCEGIGRDGFPARGPGSCGQAERHPVEGCDGRSAGSGYAVGEAQKGEEG